ncbi:uncharacterized protein LOC114309479 [Camellia sinensis]|uniref:uncharacterized protein LOC114309479 n=1 Tax=Camellia sinensis TaxID=4442 RepID=UPI001035BDDD|nr:uncharacterized protein LOC114309479 [Camellia sinensis]
MMRDCPFKSKNANRPVVSSVRSASITRSNARTNAMGNIGNETLRQGRVFALVPGDVQNTESMVSCIIFSCAQNAYVLIYSGSKHSFVLYAFSQKLTRLLEPMSYLLSVSMPYGGSIACAYVYPACDIMIGDVMLYVDLLPLGIDHFDCILGMNWLTKYCATIDCVNKFVVFRPPRLPELVFVGNVVVPLLYLIFPMKAVKLLRKGCRGYICCVLTETFASSNVETIPVACEFSDVFPKELPGALIDREIEFTIDVIPGTQPISKTPYRMTTSEFK